MTDFVAAAGRWRAMVEAHRAQNERLRDPAWQPGSDFAPLSVESFRADRERADDARVLSALHALVPPDGTVIDVGAGAGRFAIPLARTAREVVAIEPSPAMRARLTDDARRAGVSNIRLVGARWEDTSGIHGDVVFASHVVYPVLDIGPFLERMDAAAQVVAAVLVFEEPPLSWLFPFWPRVYGEERLPPPHLPQVVEVLAELGFGPAGVDLLEVEPFELGPPDVARQKLRRRLYVHPDSATDRRLGQAMTELLEGRNGVLVPRTQRPVRVGLVRWQPRAAR